jgi:hypothetical protein
MEPIVIDRDPITGDRYKLLPWAGLALTNTGRDREAVVNTHFMLLHEASATTLAERVTLLAERIGSVYHGLDDTDGVRLGAEWRGLLAELAVCNEPGRLGWLATYAESTAGWWPPGSDLLTRGLVNAIVRSPETEALHTTNERDSFFDNQFGTLCANWAGVSLFDGVADLSDPSTWGLSTEELTMAAEVSRYADALERFPGARSRIETLGQLWEDRGGCVEVTDTGVVGDDPADWLADHAGDARLVTSNRAAMSGRTVQRGGWTAPSTTEIGAGQVVAVPSLTRLSRDPRHLAAAVAWATGAGRSILTTNVWMAPEHVGLRGPLLAVDAYEKGLVGTTWQGLAGLSGLHAAALAALNEHLSTEDHGARRPAAPGRNDPCWCGSGTKYKRCHLDADRR